MAYNFVIAAKLEYMAEQPMHSTRAGDRVCIMCLHASDGLAPLFKFNPAAD